MNDIFKIACAVALGLFMKEAADAIAVRVEKKFETVRERRAEEAPAKAKAKAKAKKAKAKKAKAKAKR